MHSLLGSKAGEVAKAARFSVPCNRATHRSVTAHLCLGFCILLCMVAGTGGFMPALKGIPSPPPLWRRRGLVLQTWRCGAQEKDASFATAFSVREAQPSLLERFFRSVNDQNLRR